MNTFIEQIIGSLVRAAVIWLTGKFGADLTDDQILKIVAQVVPIVAMVAWSIWQKFGSRQKFATAQTMKAGVTEAEVEKKIQLGGAASVLAPKDSVPQQPS